jgi:hypothetical protein
MYKLALVVVQEVGWDTGSTVTAGDYIFFYVKGNENHQLGTGFLVHHRRVTQFNRLEFVSDRMSCIVLRGHWFNFIVLNMHALSENKSDDKKKDSLY